MSLLREITDAVVDTNIGISTLLRKCKVLAARLGNKEFDLWVEHELNGYNSPDEVPSYRIRENVESRGNFVGVFQSSASHIPIPPSLIPEKYREYLTKSYFMDPIIYYSNLLENAERKGTFAENWPADYLRIFGDKIFEGMNCIGAWKVIPEGFVASLLDTVRNRVLSFALKIEAEAPDAGEAEPNTKPIANEKVTQIFNTHIQGNVTNLAAGIQPSIENTQITITKNDLNSLRSFLSSIGLDKQDIDELSEAIHADEPSRNPNDLGGKVKSWLGKMVSKAGTVSWNIATTVATQLLIKALSQYYGL
ncbi:MAG: hypothetical protein HYX82_00740 [Chloroflexi bacterium]|nr:hypothetical protein [Chloroflexota bacterium]